MYGTFSEFQTRINSNKEYQKSSANKFCKLRYFRFQMIKTNIFVIEINFMNFGLKKASKFLDNIKHNRALWIISQVSL